MAPNLGHLYQLMWTGKQRTNITKLSSPFIFCSQWLLSFRLCYFQFTTQQLLLIIYRHNAVNLLDWRFLTLLLVLPGEHLWLQGVLILQSHQEHFHWHCYVVDIWDQFLSAPHFSEIKQYSWRTSPEENQKLAEMPHFHIYHHF